MTTTPTPVVTAVIVAFNDAADLAAMLPALMSPDVEVVVVDNASRDASASVAEAAGARVIESPANVGWAVGCNLGAASAQASVLAFVNPDARPSAADLVRLASLAGRADVGLAAPRFLGEDGEPQAFYFRFPSPWSGLFCFFGAAARVDRLLGRRHLSRRTYGFGAELPTEVDQPGAACVAIRAETFRRFGGFDERMFLFFADTDLCLRMSRAGLRVAVDWDLDVTHRGGGSVAQVGVIDHHHRLRADYLTYAQRHYGPGGRLFTLLAYLVFGAIAAGARVVRGHPREAGRALRLLVAGLRQARGRTTA